MGGLDSAGYESLHQSGNYLAGDADIARSFWVQQVLLFYEEVWKVSLCQRCQ